MTSDPPGPLAVDRRAQVLDVLRRQGSARISELTDALGVAAVTVRRDIAQLAAAGLVRRVHGGATLVRSATPDEPPTGAGRSTTAAPGRATAPGQQRDEADGAGVGMLVPSLDYYWPGVVEGVEAAARGRHLRLVLRGGSYESDDDRPQLQHLLDRVGAGGLVVAPRIDSPTAPATLAWLAQTGIPTVLAERSADSGPEHAAFDCVHSDHAEGAQAAVLHLLGLGHRRLGLVTSANSPTGPELRRGWFASTTHVRRTLDVITPESGSAGWEDAVESAVEACLATGTTALLVHADATAARLVQALQRHDVDVPGDVSVIAYDDEVAGLLSPPLTAVRPHRFTLGSTAVDLLAARMVDPHRPTHRILITPSLRVRASTGPPRCSPVR